MGGAVQAQACKSLFLNSVQKYHNESNVVFGGKNEEDNEEEEQKKLQERKRKEEELNNRLPDYNPKMGGKSSLNFGDGKNEENMGQKVRRPPGGQSNIQFGWMLD